MEQKFRLVDDEHVYSFEEIAEKIVGGHLVKDSLIWEPALPDWVKLRDYPDFLEVFAAYEAEAEEALKKAMGTDAESLERKEMQKMFSDVAQEKQSLFSEQRPWLKWTITALACLAMLGSTVKFLNTLFYTQEGQALLGTVIEEQVETIDIERIRMASGVTKLDEVKGIAIKKVDKKKEKDLLAEILADMKREEALESQQATPETQKEGKIAVAEAKAEVKKKPASIFDKVSDEEVEQFRRSLLAKGGGYTGSKNAVVRDNTAKMAAIPEELSSRQVAQVVKENSNNTIAYCYNKSLKLDASLSGKLEVTLSVLGTGRVAKVDTNTQKFKGTNLERCVKELIKKRWVFPEFNGTLTEVTIPFVLSSE